MVALCGKQRSSVEPDALIAWFGEHGVTMGRIGLEALCRSGSSRDGESRSLRLIETRHVRAAF